MNVDLEMQVNNAGVGGVVVDQDALRALNIDPDTWVCRIPHDVKHICLASDGLSLLWLVAGCIFNL